MVTKSGGKKPPALVAVAHTLLILIYEVLRTGEPYRERQRAPLPDTQTERLIRHHVRRLGKLGVRVYSDRPAPAPAKGRSQGQGTPAQTKRTQQTAKNKGPHI
jgi:hypothetical protein